MSIAVVPLVVLEEVRLIPKDRPTLDGKVVCVDCRRRHYPQDMTKTDEGYRCTDCA